MIIVCFIYFDNILFLAVIRLCSQCQNVSFLLCSDEKSPFQVGKYQRKNQRFFACGALAASISVGIVIPFTWFVYLYKQTVSITVVVMGTKQFSDKTTHRQQVKTGFVQKWENRSPGLLQDYSRILPFFKDSISSQFCITQRFKVHFFSQKR